MDTGNSCQYTFNQKEKSELQIKLMQWYHMNKRELPWRKELSTDCNRNEYAYAVWVSEIMLQQTRVSTVIEYFKRWMTKWPSVACLAKASREEVNSMWSGLGYYSRGRRLLEGACKVMEDFDGMIPANAASLMKHLPGVGRYTASAIASIAFGEPVGVLDGNVVRLLCRLRAIGGIPTKKEVNQHLWWLTNDIVDRKQPGDFNQALMELGATICTPTNPQCSSCPIKSICKAYSQLNSNCQEDKLQLLSSNCTSTNNVNATDEVDEIVDVENCNDCLAIPYYSPQLGVENYPQKPSKKAPRTDCVLVTIIEMQQVDEDSKLLVRKRPACGLLAGLWEFPNEAISESNLSCDKKRKRSTSSATPADINAETSMKRVNKMLKDLKMGSCEVVKCEAVGNYLHKFSHIHQTNVVYRILITCKEESKISDTIEPYRWVTAAEFEKLAKPTLVINIFNMFNKIRLFAARNKIGDNPKSISKAKKQASISSYFAKK